MAKSIVTVGFEVPGQQEIYEPMKSDISLLDHDIAVFDPVIFDFYGFSYDDYQGKPCLDDTYSFRLKEKLSHWRREVLEAVRAGKSVFVLLNKRVDVFVATGQHTYSGTGRNRQTTRHVALHSNYALIPGEIDIVNAKGRAMKRHEKAKVITSYWSEMGELSEYKVYLEGDGVKPLICTKLGDKAVGALIRYKDAPGALVLLPYVDFEKDEFLEYKAEEEKSYWTDEATQAGARFVAAIVGLDKSLREGTEVTVAPDWVEAEAYRLPAEGKLRDKLLQVEVEIESLHQKKEGTQSQLAEETALKNLLFENGTPLENAIHMALRMMGFKVSRYEEGESEFDVVFECAEGRLIGEVEGKDNAAVNIAKLRQLEMNIHEDFERDEVEEMAKGALFGNAFRFLEPENRGDFFTQKCLTAAARSQTALVRSVDLFNVAKYLSEKSNNTFAKKCRTAIIESVGVVEFPPIPASKAKAKEKVSAD